MADEGLAAAPPGIQDEDLTERWKTDPWLHALVVANNDRYQRLIKELLGAARVSTDPKVTALSWQITEIESQVLIMTGKKRLERAVPSTRPVQR